MQLLVNFRLFLLWMVLPVILINSVEHKLTNTLDSNLHNNKLLIGIRLFRLCLISPSEVHLRFLRFAFRNSSKYDRVSFHRKHKYLIFRTGRQVGQVVGGGKRCDLLNLFVTLCTRNNFRTTFEYTPLAFVNLALETLLLALTPLNIYNWFIIYKKVSKMAPLSNGY